MKRLTRLGVRVVMTLLLIVLVSIVAVPVKADEPNPEELSRVIPPKIWELRPPEFGKEFLISESDGRINAADIVFANNNEGLAAWQQEVRVCHQWCEFVLQVFSQHFSTETKETNFAGKLLLGELKFSVSKEQAEAIKQEPLVLYHNPEVQTGGAGLAAALETNGWAGNPSVAWNPSSGNYLVTFWSNGNEEGWPRIYAWQILSSGKLGAANMQIGDDGKNVYRQFYPSIAVAPSGKYLIVWEQDATDCPNCYQVFGQWLDQNAQPIGGNFQISTGTYEQHPQLVWVDQRDAFLVVYMYPYMDYYGFHVEIRGQWISANGEIGGPFVISEDLLDKGVPTLAVNSQGDILIAWSAANGKIYGRLVNPWGNSQVLAETQGQILNGPKVASFGKDGFLLTWEQFPPYGYANQSRVWGKIYKVVKPMFFFDLAPERPLLPENPLLVSGRPFQLSQTETNQRFPEVGTWGTSGLAVWEVDNGDGGLWGRFFW